MLKELVKFANHLDRKGLRKEADLLDRVIKRYAAPIGINTARQVALWINQIIGQDAIEAREKRLGNTDNDEKESVFYLDGMNEGLYRKFCDASSKKIENSSHPEHLRLMSNEEGKPPVFETNNMKISFGINEKGFYLMTVGFKR